MTTVDSLNIAAQNKKSSEKVFLFSIGTFATSILAIVALLGLFLTLAGYGVALSVETQFGIPHASIFKSNFDLFSLSVWFITWGLSNLLELLKTIFVMPMYWKAVGIAVLFGITCSLLAFLAIYIKGWLTQKNFSARFPSLKHASNPTLGGVFTLIFTGVSAFITLIGVPLVLYAGLLFCLLVGAIPAISAEAGESHIRKFVVNPAHCMSTATREQRIAAENKAKPKNAPREYVATCVKLVDGDRVIAAGRVVFSTTDLIVLYDPTSGKVTRESMSGRSLEVVSQL